MQTGTNIKRGNLNNLPGVSRSKRTAYAITDVNKLIPAKLKISHESLITLA